MANFVGWSKYIYDREVVDIFDLCEHTFPGAEAAKLDNIDIWRAAHSAALTLDHHFRPVGIATELLVSCKQEPKKCLINAP